jgi:hypothetical protein
MRIKGTGKIQSPLQKSIYASYFQWVKTLKGYDISITGIEYIGIWEANLDKWRCKGRNVGQYYLKVIDPSKVVSLRNVDITMRTEHANATSKPPKVQDDEINDTFQRKFKDDEMQRKFDEAIQAKRTNYHSINLIKERAKGSTSVLRKQAS